MPFKCGNGVPKGKEIGPVYEDNKLGTFVNELVSGSVPSEFICEMINVIKKAKMGMEKTAYVFVLGYYYIIQISKSQP